MKKLFLIFIFIYFCLFLIFSETQALCIEEDGLVPCGKGRDARGNLICPCELCHFFVMLDTWVDKTLSIFVPLIATLMIAVGGFMLIIGYGGPAEILEGGKKGGPALVARAKKLFKSVVVSLLIIYGAWLIINTFFQIIGVEKWTGLKEGWWQIKCD